MPRDQLSVPVVRSILRHSLLTLGTTEGTVVHLEKQLVFEQGAVATKLDQRTLKDGPWSDPR